MPTHHLAGVEPIRHPEEESLTHSGRGETGASVDAGSDGANGSTDSRPHRDPDRELDELISELRVVLPGVAVIFAFLLTVPFHCGVRFNPWR